jgi:hypothetical protein
MFKAEKEALKGAGDVKSKGKADKKVVFEKAT